MLSKGEKILLFLLYFLVTTIIPVVILATDVPTLFGDRNYTLVIGMGVLVILFIIGKYEWKQMPDNYLKMLGWFFSPIIIFILSLVIFDFRSLVENLKISGGIITLSVIISFCLVQISDLWFKQKMIKKNIETYKTPFLKSYWKKKWWSLPDDILMSIVELLFFTSLGIVVFVVTVVRYVPYPQSLYIFVVFVISVLSNSIIFYRTERPKMI